MFVTFKTIIYGFCKNVCFKYKNGGEFILERKSKVSLPLSSGDIPEHI